MKSLIVGVCTVLIYCFTIVMISDVKTHERQNEYLKYVCDQTACSAALFYNDADFSDGKKVFNVTEGIKVIEHQMKYLLKLDNSFNPLSDTYWKDNITYKPYFFDDSNTTFPYEFIDPDTGYKKMLNSPTVVVTIFAGRARYRVSLATNNQVNIRSGCYEWKER